MTSETPVTSETRVGGSTTVPFASDIDRSWQPPATGTRRYQITHRTSYDYDDVVSSSYGRCYLTPREIPGQRVLNTEVVIDPEPGDQSTGIDVYGNIDTYFHVTSRHRQLQVTGRSVTEVDPIDPELLTGRVVTAPWEQSRPARLSTPEAALASEFVLDLSPPEICAQVRDYASEIFTPGRPLIAAIEDLTHRIYSDFTYRSGSTQISTRVETVMERREGVCQDFARVALACMRSVGLAGRYVSGYLATDPPPGKEKVIGADATHAWAAVWVPVPSGGRWLAMDPTNDKLANERHITVAVGRDYEDVPPLRGVIYTDSTKSEIDVSVDVAAIPRD